MSIIVNNSDNQLNIEINKVLDVYSFKSIKSVSRGVDANGNYYIAINFIANDKNNSLRIYLKDVSDPVTWTNDLTGAINALAEIRSWMNEVIDVQITEANDSIQIYASDGTNNVPVLVGQQACSDSLAVTLCTQQAGVKITPNIQVSINEIAIITDPVYSVSFANIGTADALVSFDTGLTTVPLSPGVTVNMDAGGLGNFYESATFAWDTQSNLGSKLVITYNT
jgi:hypothetical protein